MTYDPLTVELALMVGEPRATIARLVGEATPELAIGRLSADGHYALAVQLADTRKQARR